MSIVQGRPQLAGCIRFKSLHLRERVLVFPMWITFQMPEGTLALMSSGASGPTQKIKSITLRFSAKFSPNTWR